MLTWMDRRTNPAKDIGGEEPVGPKDAAKASHDPPKLKLGSGNHHSHSHLRSGQPRRNHEEGDVLQHGGTRKDGQPQSLRAASLASRPEHRHRHGGKCQWRSAMEQPLVRDSTQLLAPRAMTMFLPCQRHAYRQLRRRRRVLLHHRGKRQLTSHRRPLCWSLQLPLVKPGVRQAQRKRETRRAAGFSQTHVGRGESLRTRGRGT